MTTFCSGNTSSPIPGVANTVVLTSGVIQSILDASSLAWLSPWVGYISGVITLDVPTYCSVDPPDDPGITGTDLLGLITLGPGPLTQGAVDKLVQLIKRMAWSHFCQCDVVTTPTITPPTQPTDLPSVNPPGQVGGGQIQPCKQWTSSKVGFDAGDDSEWLLFDPPIQNSDTLTILPAGSTSIQFHSEVDFGSTVGATYQFNINWYGADGFIGGTVSAGDSWTLNPGDLDDRTKTVPAGAVALDYWVTKILSGGGATDQTVTATTTAYCGGFPGQIVSPCCPPDSIATAKLDNILSLLTLIQRQAAPFAYVTGAVHAGLSGTGTISIGSSLGILLSVTVPARAGREAGTPVMIFDCGWLNFATPDGYTERFFVSSDSQVVIPRLPGIYTSVGYSFPDDVTVTITELAREP